MQLVKVNREAHALNNNVTVCRQKFAKSFESLVLILCFLYDESSTFHMGHLSQRWAIG